MKKPNLYIVGHPRTGTSSLHDYLNQHPDIFMTPIKEPNYFAKDFQAESDRIHQKALYFPFRTEKRYLKCYKNWRHEKLGGEASSTNLYSKIAYQEIYRFNSHSKIIMAFREPVDFLNSYHSTAIFSLGENVRDLKEALALEAERKKGNYLSKRVITPSWLYYSDFINYADQLGRYLSLFDRSQIKVIIFDDFKADPAGTFKNILEFLDVEPNFEPEFKVVNPFKRDVKLPGLKYFLLDSPYFRKFQHLILPDVLYGKLTKLYLSKARKSEAPKQQIAPFIKNELKARFYPEVEKLARLLDRDLISLWGYSGILN